MSSICWRHKNFWTSSNWIKNIPKISTISIVNREYIWSANILLKVPSNWINVKTITYKMNSQFAFIGIHTTMYHSKNEKRKTSSIIKLYRSKGNLQSQTHTHTAYTHATHIVTHTLSKIVALQWICHVTATST